MLTLVRSVDDLADETVDLLLGRARAFEAGAAPVERGSPRIVGLVFFETSLRTRLGFAAAAARIGARSIEVVEVRSSAVSMPERWDDTLRVVAGYSDVVVARVGHPLVATAIPAGVDVPVLSGGDVGAEAEHPSQALIDRYAIERAVGPVAELGIAIYGDLRMRSVRSLLRLLARTPPRRVVLVTEPALLDGFQVPAELQGLAEMRAPGHLEGVDVLYVAGIPHGALDEDGRTRLRVTEATLAELPRQAVVLSPLPVIDEIDRAVLGDPRMRAFEQSDRAMYVRMALLEHLLVPSQPGEQP